MLRRRGGGRGGHRAARALPRRPDHPRPQRRLAARRTRSGCCRDMRRRARLRRGPVRRRGRLLRPRGDGRVPPRHRPADRHQHDRHRLAAAGARACAPHAVDIPLADPHFWTMAGSVRVAQLCHDFGPDLGLALQQPLRRLAGDVHPRRRRRARARSPRSTRTGSGRTASASRREPLQIEGGHDRGAERRRASASSSTATRLAEAHAAVPASTASARATTRPRCSTSSPGWTFDPKRPCLVR